MKQINFTNDALSLANDAVRSSKKLNWKRVGEKADVSPSTISLVLNGNNPDMDSLLLVYRGGIDFKRFIKVEGPLSGRHTASVA